MAEILTDWEMALMYMQISDYEQLCPCECEGVCTCDETEDRCSPS
jgi:hypothetical protein